MWWNGWSVPKHSGLHLQLLVLSRHARSTTLGKPGMTSLAPSSRLVRASLPLRLRNGSSPDPLAVTSLSARRHYSCVPHVATPTALPERPIHPRCARRTHARPPRRTFTTTPCPHAGSSIKNAKMIRAEMNKMKARTGPAPSIKLQTKQMQKQAIQDGSVLEQVQILPGKPSPAGAQHHRQAPNKRQKHSSHAHGVKDPAG